MSRNAYYQAQFEQTFSKPLASPESAKEDLRRVAELVWFHNFVPELDQLHNPEAISKAAYVVDFLASNHLVPSPQKQRLRLQLKVAEAKLAALPACRKPRTFYVGDALPRKNKDQLAKKWRFDSGMKPNALGLLDMQRRVNLPKREGLTVQLATAN
jgi:hypothetical protein